MKCYNTFFQKIRGIRTENRMAKKIGFLFLVPVWLLCSGSLRGEVVDRIVALVNNEVITLSELEEVSGRALEQVRQTTLPSEREAKLKEVRREILDRLIENKVLDQEIKNKKIEIPDRDVDNAIDDVMKQNRITETQLKMALAKDGVTYSRYRQHVREELGKMRLINREIKSKLVIKDEDIRQFYQENLKKFEDPLEVKVQQIFLAIPQGATEEQIARIRKETQDLLERIRKGEDFSRLAKDYSQGPEAREGGILGFFRQKELRPELEEASFKLDPGAVSDLVRTPEGFHILRVLERKGGKPKPFAEVQSKIREEMIQTESDRQFKEWMKALKAKAYIEIRL